MGSNHQTDGQRPQSFDIGPEWNAGFLI